MFVVVWLKCYNVFSSPPSCNIFLDWNKYYCKKHKNCFGWNIAYENQRNQSITKPTENEIKQFPRIYVSWEGINKWLNECVIWLTGRRFAAINITTSSQFSNNLRLNGSNLQRRVIARETNKFAYVDYWLCYWPHVFAQLYVHRIASHRPGLVHNKCALCCLAILNNIFLQHLKFDKLNLSSIRSFYYYWRILFFAQRSRNAIALAEEIGRFSCCSFYYYYFLHQIKFKNISLSVW